MRMRDILGITEVPGHPMEVSASIHMHESMKLTLQKGQNSVHILQLYKKFIRLLIKVNQNKSPSLLCQATFSGISLRSFLPHRIEVVHVTSM